MIKLVCNTCDFELTDPEEIELALEGQEAWETAMEGKGADASGVCPCKYYVRCGGEMMLVKGKKKRLWRRS